MSSQKQQLPIDLNGLFVESQGVDGGGGVALEMWNKIPIGLNYLDE